MPKRKTKSVHVPYRKTVYIAGYPVTAMKPRRGGGVDLLVPEGCPVAGEITEVVDLREPEEPLPDLVDTLAKLREISGDRWDNVDPDEYIRELRS